MENIGSNRVASEKTAEADITETPPPIRAENAKPLSFSNNGVLKRHNPLHHHHRSFVGGHHHHGGVVVTYKECLKNHAASLGGHAVDGCGEFMPPPPPAANPTLLKCAACGCHRNFHRREPDETTLPKSAVEYQSHHRHRPLPPPPPPNHGSPNNSPSSPPPISSSYYPSAPHMLLALSTGFSGAPTDNNNTQIIPTNPNSKKRFRTKFTQDQKNKMLGFAEKVGWKIQKRDEELINEFCTQIGVERGVLKVWMHNNKSTLCKKDQSNAVIDNVNGTDFHNTAAPPQFNLHQESSNNSDNVNVAVNGSSSSS